MNNPNEGEPDVRQIVLSRINSVDLTLVTKAQDLTKVLDEINPQGEKVALKDLIGQEIVILQVNPFIGKYGPAGYVIAVDKNNVLLNFCVSKSVILPKLLMAIDHLPLRAIVVEKESGRGHYYDLE
jgi:hypothetical protein